MKIISATASEFLAAQEAFLTSNILQSHQIAELQEERNHYNKVERLLFLEDEQVIGLAVVDYRKKWKYFQEALVIQGPVLNYSSCSGNPIVGTPCPSTAGYRSNVPPLSYRSA